MTGIDLANVPAAIFVFSMEGCPACSLYLPMLARRINERSREGFVLVASPRPLTSRSIPVLIYDAASDDDSVHDLMHAYSVTATPTTLVLLRGPGSCKLEGALTLGQIDQLLDMAKSTW